MKSAPWLRPALVALGFGLTAALPLIPASGTIPWREVAIAGVSAVLSALGVGAYHATSSTNGGTK